MQADIAEPLEELAKFAWEHAPHLCSAEHGCADFHAMWTWLRFLNVIAGTGSDADFFIANFERFAREGKRRVLISGSADTGMLAQVLQGYGRAGVEPEVVFLDQCETPVAQNRHWAEKLGLRAEFIRQDIRDLDCAPVDVVCTHSFLIFFPAEERQRVLGAWARNLKPGGAVITSNRLRTEGAPATRRMSDEEVASRASEVVATARKAGVDAGTAARLGEGAAAMWGTSGRRHTHITEAEIRALFGAAGLELVHLERPQNRDRDKPSFGGETRLQDARAEIIARKVG